MDNRLFIVGICEGELIKKALVLQKLFSEKYHLYKHTLPSLHITLEVVDGNAKNINKIREAVLKASQKIAKFTVQASGFACFPPPFKSVGLLIEKSVELEYAVETVQRQLLLEGIKSVKQFGADWVFHLTLVNTFLADRQWSEAEFLEACAIVDNVKLPLQLTGTMTQIAIWHPVREPERMSEGTFDLKEKKTVTIESRF